MRLFLAVFFTLYGGMHLYLFLKIRSAFAPGIYASIMLGLFMLLMTSAPVLIRVLVHEGHEISARVLAYTGYTWMAAIFLYFCISISIDILNAVPRVIGVLINMDLSLFMPRPRTAFIISSLMSIAICTYGYFEARDIRIERLTMETTKLPVGMDRLRIVHISDVHLGLIVREDRLRRIVDIVKSATPDILVSTGDLVDAQLNNLSGLADILADIEPIYGKYAITGNHEYYAGVEKALEFTRQAGFTILRNGAVKGVIAIIGVDDPEGVQMGVETPIDEAGLLRGVSGDGFKILLKHRPVIVHESLGLFDLQLSGHTHRGQIFPFTYLSAISYPMSAGRYDLPKGSVLYVSRGTGTWGPAIRFLAMPEVTVIDLVRKIEKETPAAPRPPEGPLHRQRKRH